MQKWSFPNTLHKPAVHIELRPQAVVHGGSPCARSGRAAVAGGVRAARAQAAAARVALLSKELHSYLH